MCACWETSFIEADISAVDYLVGRQSKEGVSIMGVSGRDAHIDATFAFEVKFMSLFFLHIGKGFATKNTEVTDVGLDPMNILVRCCSSGQCGSVL